MGMDENNIRATVRIGKVMSLDKPKHKARVKFEDEDMTSGWLPVIQRPKTVVIVKANGRHSHSVTTSGGSGTAAENGTHAHEAETEYWMPEVNDRVLCLYLPLFNSDGFILGAIV